MRNVVVTQSRSGERGAVSIKAVAGILIAAVILFVVIRFVPVYTEQRSLMYDLDELARIASVRNYKGERIAQDIEKLRSSYNLPEDSIRLVTADRTVKIELAYTKEIDLLVTKYNWEVDYTAEGRDTLSR
jgi:hypothetical protein